MTKQEWHPFHDHERITNFWNYHEEITPIRGDKEIAKEVSLNWIKENIAIRKNIPLLKTGKIPIQERKTFQLGNGKYSNL